MNTSEILTAIDNEIARLTQARDLIASQTTGKRRGRPPASAKAVPVRKSNRKPLSAEARAKIAAAQKARWAKAKKAAK